jgi:hypothetical protein
VPHLGVVRPLRDKISVEGLRFTVWGLGQRIQGAENRVEGFGFRVWSFKI